jgi:UDP:flavonoid glycosyltransferase YjiC (YdhE family)
MQPNCLFLINGLGMGNSTRCHAVIEHLAARGWRVHVLTSGNGLIYFADKQEVASLTPMEPLFYSGKDGRISGWRTLGSLRRLYSLARVKRAQLEAALLRVRPDLAVTDSEYALAPLRRRGIPIVGLNNSEVVVCEYLRHPDRPRAIRSHFWAVEFMDYLFHKTVCDLVISPSARPLPPRSRKFRRVGLIVRREVLDLVARTGRPEFPPPGQIRSVVFMLSGSIFATPVAFLDEPLPFHVDVVGRTGDSRGSVTYHGRLMHNVPLLMKADALVTNGGFSAVSEAMAMNKPAFVVPVPGHAEQFVNARVLEDLGFGYVASASGVMDRLLDLYRRGRWDGLKPRAPLTGFDGAREAADILCEFLERRGRAKETAS